MTRPSWQTYFMRQAYNAATRATCDRKHVGCVLVKNNRGLVSGYNGSLPGQPHCDDAGHLYFEGETGCKRTIHAEMNALVIAARNGIAVEGCEAYVTCMPCYNCLKALIAAGVTKVYYHEEYRQDHAKDIAKQAGVPLIQVELPGPVDSPVKFPDNL